MLEMHLKQSGFTYSACGPLPKNKERIQKFKETGDSKYIYKNKLDIACFQHDMAYGDCKDLARRTGSDKTLRGQAFNIPKNPKYDDIRGGLLLWFTFFLIKSIPTLVLMCMQIIKLNKIINYLKNYTNQLLKLVYTIFYQICIFHQMIALQKL